jgi:hypothetical protein
MRLNITAKIWLSIGVFILGSLITIGFGQVQSLLSEKRLVTTNEALFPAAQHGQDADAAFQRMTKAFQDAVLLQDAAALDAGKREGESTVAELKAAAALPRLSAERAAALAALATSVANLTNESHTLYQSMVAAGASMTDEMMQHSKALSEKNAQAKASLQQMATDLAGDLSGELGAAVSGSVRQRWLSAGMFAVVLIVAGIVVTVTIRRSVVLPVRTAVSELNGSAAKVFDASRQVSHSAQSLSGGATQQAASLEETSASLEEMASMTRQNAQNSQQAAALTGDVERLITRANDALGEMVTSMHAIKDSSNRVAKIIKTIDEIAFQTNILALNAAVEAARAGEAGMGFAVVADEVRALAQRSAQAARDTAGLIEESIARSNEGHDNVTKVTAAITSVTAAAVQLKQLIDEVSTATGQQAQGIQQVSQAITHIERVTQTTAASAEESAAASEELTSQAEYTLRVVAGLSGMVGRAGDQPGAGAEEADQEAVVERQAAPAAVNTGRVARVVKLARPTPARVAHEPNDEEQSTGTYAKF